jgi:hypothetical protein
VEKGDVPGHELHGNQYSDGGGNGARPESGVAGFHADAKDHHDSQAARHERMAAKAVPGSDKAMKHLDALNAHREASRAHDMAMKHPESQKYGDAASHASEAAVTATSATWDRRKKSDVPTDLAKASCTCSDECDGCPCDAECACDPETCEECDDECGEDIEKHGTSEGQRLGWETRHAAGEGEKPVEKGDLPGHEFHGNQYTDGAGASDKQNEHQAAYVRHGDKEAEHKDAANKLHNLAVSTKNPDRAKAYMAAARAHEYASFAHSEASGAHDAAAQSLGDAAEARAASRLADRRTDKANEKSKGMGAHVKSDDPTDIEKETKMPDEQEPVAKAAEEPREKMDEVSKADDDPKFGTPEWQAKYGKGKEGSDEAEPVKKEDPPAEEAKEPEVKKSNRFADALLSAVKEPIAKKAGPHAAAIEELEKCSGAPAITAPLKKDFFGDDDTPVLSLGKLPETDVQFALTILGTLRQAASWITTLIGAEDAEVETEKHGPALDSAKAGVDAAVAGLATFIGEEAQEITTEKADMPKGPALLLKRRLDALDAAVAALGERIEKADAAPGLERLEKMIPPVADGEVVRRDAEAFAKALGDVLEKEREKTSETVGELTKQLKAVGEGVERILNARVPGGPARIDVRKMATAGPDESASDEVTGRFEVLKGLWDVADDSARPFLRQQLAIAQAAVSMRK